MKTLKRIKKAVGNAIIILAIMPTTVIKKIIAVLNIKKYRQIGTFIAKAKLVRQSMKGNTWFPAPPVALADNGVFDTHIKDLDAAETLALTKVKGAAQVRDDKKAIVLNDLHLLMAYVQTIADANPKNAEAIVIGSGLDVKHEAVYSKDALTVKPKKGESGTMIITAKKVEGTLAGLWEYKFENDNTWIEMDATPQSKTSITGLTPGSKIIVRHRPILRKGKGEWITSQPAVVV
jgi:hypothetical protein